MAKKAGPPKRGRGRPPLPPGDVKENFTVRIEPALRKALEREAKRAKVDLTEFVRDLLHAAAQRFGR